MKIKKETIKKSAGIGWKIAAFACIFLMLWVVWIPIHEWSHLTFLQFGGGDGYVISKVVNIVWNVPGIGGYMVSVKDASYPDWLGWVVAFGGGFGTFLLYLTLWYWIWRSPTCQHMVLETSFFFWGFYNLFYGFNEVFLHSGHPLFYIGKWICVSLAAAITLAIYGKKLKRWFNSEEDYYSFRRGYCFFDPRNKKEMK